MMDNLLKSFKNYDLLSHWHTLASGLHYIKVTITIKEVTQMFYYHFWQLFHSEPQVDQNETTQDIIWVMPLNLIVNWQIDNIL